LSDQEFTVPDAYHYNRASPMRWIVSHIFRYRWLVIGCLLILLLGSIVHAVRDWLIGVAFANVERGSLHALTITTFVFLAMALLWEGASISSAFLITIVRQRVSCDTRDEFYLSLLGKSQSFHNRQRVGNIVAHSSNDVEKLNEMISPGLYVTIGAYGGLLVALVLIALLNVQLLLVPGIYIVCLWFILPPYQKRLARSYEKMQHQFGDASAVLTEALTGIEAIKATGQEQQEKQKFHRSMLNYRDSYEKNGWLQGRYLPNLMLGIFIVLALLHALWLYSQHSISLGVLISFMALMIENLRYVTESSLYNLSLLSSGFAAAKRILQVIAIKEARGESATEQGHRGKIQGDVVFECVTFGYEKEAPVLKRISFHAQAGQVIAIVGQTGSGKSTLIKLINRIYEADEGRILIDGVDVCNWDLTALRAQISTIEQDIFLFSCSLAENIAYGFAQQPPPSVIENAARAAQAHHFIMSFQQGYETIVGDRGVTLSGGQRQRIAIARALLTNPRILILDDATSAIDSATEDEIQQAIDRVQQGRTTFLITHRLSQICRADLVLVLQDGEIIDQGSHEDLLTRCHLYQRIFSYNGSPVTESAGVGVQE
jgi:ATP-binding cassette, subfamily B, bacterial